MGVRGNQTTETGRGLSCFYLPSAVISFCKAYYIDLNRVEDKQRSMSCECTVNANRHVVPLVVLLRESSRCVSNFSEE